MNVYQETVRKKSDLIIRGGCILLLQLNVYKVLIEWQQGTQKRISDAPSST